MKFFKHPRLSLTLFTILLVAFLVSVAYIKYHEYKQSHDFNNIITSVRNGDNEAKQYSVDGLTITGYHKDNRSTLSFIYHGSKKKQAIISPDVCQSLVKLFIGNNTISDKQVFLSIENSDATFQYIFTPRSISQFNDKDSVVSSSSTDKPTVVAPWYKSEHTDEENSPYTRHEFQYKYIETVCDQVQDFGNVFDTTSLIFSYSNTSPKITSK